MEYGTEMEDQIDEKHSNGKVIEPRHDKTNKVTMRPAKT